jgi:hypothetical protein
MSIENIVTPSQNVVSSARMENDRYSIKAVMRCLKILDLAASVDHPLSVN